MEPNPAAHASSSSLIRPWPWFVLLLIVLFTGFIRFRLLDMPLERDEGEYAYAGQLILQGIPPYELAYNMKLPGTYYACALGMAIFGQNSAGIHATLLVVNSLTILFVFLLARKLFGVLPALVAAASYAVMSVSPVVMGMAAHANHFVVLFAVPATWLLLKGCDADRRRLFFFSGLLYGLAFLMKQQGVYFGMFGGVYLLWRSWRQRNFAGTIKTLLWYGSGVFVPFVLICLLMAWDGVFSRFWFWTFTYAHSYVAISSWRDGSHWLFQHLQSAFVNQPSLGLWILSIMGAVLGLFEKALRGRTVFILGLWVFSFMGTATGFYFRSHYFILVLPAFSLLVGLTVEALPQLSTLRSQVYTYKIILISLFAGFLAASFYCQRNIFFLMPGIEVNRAIYPSEPFIESVAVANYLREHSPEAARIAVLGSEPEIYFYSRRHSATGYIYIYALNEPQPNAALMQLDMIHEIELAKPEYLVWVGFERSWLLKPASDPTLSRWAVKYLREFYARIAIVDRHSDGKLISPRDDDAENAIGRPGNYIAVYKRLDDGGGPPMSN